jgi:copper(I)-binding protein
MNCIKEYAAKNLVQMPGVMLIAFLALFVSNAATAKDMGAVMVHDAWARASIGKTPNSAGFMMIMNHGKQGDRLVEAKADIAAKVELHTHIMDGSVMRMRRVEGIAVPASGSAELKPGGYHVMFIGLRKPLKAGTSFPLTLVFEKAKPMTIKVEVRPLGGKSKMMDHKHMHHGTK